MGYRLNIGVASVDHPYLLAEFSVEMPGEIACGAAEITIGGIVLEIIDVRWSMENLPQPSVMRLVAEAYDGGLLIMRERERRFSGPRCHVNARADRRHLVALAAAVMEADDRSADCETNQRALKR